MVSFAFLVDLDLVILVFFTGNFLTDDFGVVFLGDARFGVDFLRESAFFLGDARFGVDFVITEMVWSLASAKSDSDDRSMFTFFTFLGLDLGLALGLGFFVPLRDRCAPFFFEPLPFLFLPMVCGKSKEF